ncbi:MAG: hypothetical protein K9M98_00565 [Cephaloticoccus sp.]|nr:hypothetical protein [Cephaloticoccus sp.]MCF7758970.1 hypothetical protein [Cephaloticoccus sp.]
MKNIHTPSLFAGAIAATILISLGLSFPISMDLLVGYATVAMLVALALLEYTPSRKRLQVK